MYDRFPNRVPFDAAGSRQNTVVLLVGTAREHGLTTRYHITKDGEGFLVSDALADLLEEAPEADESEADAGGDDPEANEPDKKTSGNRAEKKAKKGRNT